MRIHIASTFAPATPPDLRDRVRLALGSHAQAVRSIEIHGGAAEQGCQVRLRLLLEQRRRLEVDAWHPEAGAALDLALARARRVIGRQHGNGYGGAPSGSRLPRISSR